MRRGTLAGAAGWGAFAVVLWMWSGSGREGVMVRAPVQDTGNQARAIVMAPIEGRVVRTPAGGGFAAPEVEHQVVVMVPADEEGEVLAPRPARARLRVTLETLSVAQAICDLTPGENMAEAIQTAAARAGRPEWFTADWDRDGVLTGSDLTAYAAAFQAKSTSADLNRDGCLDAADFAEFLREFNEMERRPVV